MKKIIEIVVTAPQWLYFVLPSILGYMTRIQPEKGSNTRLWMNTVYVLFIFSYSYSLAFGKFLKGVNPTSNRIYNYLLLVVMLFIEVIICAYDKGAAKSSYYLPQFVFDFFSPEDIAVKLLSLTVAFLLLLMLYRKSLELYAE